MAVAEGVTATAAKSASSIAQKPIDIDKLLRLIDAHRALVSTYQQTSARYRQAHADLGRLQLELMADTTSEDQVEVVGRSLTDLETIRANDLETMGLSVSAVRRLIAGHRLVQSLHADMTALGGKVRDSVQLMERLVDYARSRGEHLVI